MTFQRRFYGKAIFLLWKSQRICRDKKVRLLEITYKKCFGSHAFKYNCVSLWKVHIIFSANLKFLKKTTLLLANSVAITILFVCARGKFVSKQLFKCRFFLPKNNELNKIMIFFSKIPFNLLPEKKIFASDRS